jgi:chorismate dehydratase
MAQAASALDSPAPDVVPATVTIGAVDYLNTVPLIAGLEDLESFEIRTDVPANQVGLLERDAVDMALCSSIDLIRSKEPLMVVPVGMLGCEGPTLTVRLFSRVPLGRIKRVICDRESHTSVQLLRVFLRECHGVEPELISFDARSTDLDSLSAEEVDAILLIGDKVVTSVVPEDFVNTQVDLGEAWFEMTGLPFVFATWLCRIDRTEHQLERIRLAARILDRTRLRNTFRISQLASIHAPRHDWPVDMARLYFIDNLVYDFDERALAGLRRFLELADGPGGDVRLLEGI